MRPRTSATQPSALTASLKRRSQMQGGSGAVTRVVQQPRTLHYNHAQFDSNSSGRNHSSSSTTFGDQSSFSARIRRSPISATVTLLRHRLFGPPPPSANTSSASSATGSGKSSAVPVVLRSLLIAFFALVAIAYMVISPNLANTIQATDTLYTRCDDAATPAGVACIDEHRLEAALQMVRRTAAELQRRAIARQCDSGGSGDDLLPAYISGNEVLRAALDAGTTASASGGGGLSLLRESLGHMAHLVALNPRWGIERCAADGTPIDAVAVEDDHLGGQPLRADQLHFVLPQPAISLRCKFYNKLQKFYTLVGALALAAGLAYAALRAHGWWRRRCIARKDTVDFMIADIIQALIERAAAAVAVAADSGLAASDAATVQAAAVAVQHLRDQLIVPAQRVRLQWAWSEAIGFLEANESRIRFEVGRVNGEDCQTMRWTAGGEQPDAGGGTPRALRQSTAAAAAEANHRQHASNASANSGTPTATSAAATSTVVKKWQSPAFDKANKIADPPTPCLKIRHMFEPHEPMTAALLLAIQDAVLEKVAHTGCRVYDVQLDPAQCCVYVRCATPADAGIVHEQINGWWFDSRLVSIKFLHLERYVQRFPLALGGPRCLQPSNGRMLSMSACAPRAVAPQRQANGGGGGAGGGGSDEY